MELKLWQNVALVIQSAVCRISNIITFATECMSDVYNIYIDNCHYNHYCSYHNYER